MTVLYNDGVSIDVAGLSGDACTRVLWHLYKFFNHGSNTHFTVEDSYPGSGGDWDTEDGPNSGAWFVVECTSGYYGGGSDYWQAFFGANNVSTTLACYGTQSAGLYVAFAYRGDWNVSTDQWNASSDYPVAPNKTSKLMPIFSSNTAKIHLMTFNSDGKTFFFGASSSTTESEYYATDVGCMMGYYKNCLPCDGTSSPRQDYPGFVFASGYPTLTDVSTSWAYNAPSTTDPNGWVTEYASSGYPQGYDRARLSHYLGQTTSYLRGRKPGTFVNLPIPIYGLAPATNTVIYLAGFTTMVLAASMDRAWYSTDGQRRNLVRISVPLGTKITW